MGAAGSNKSLAGGERRGGFFFPLLTKMEEHNEYYVDWNKNVESVSYMVLGASAL